MEVMCVIQARYGSSRLPGKVMENIGNVSVLEHVVRRVQAACEHVVVATPNEPKDACVFDKARALGVRAYMHQGPQEDVLARFYAVAQEYKPDVVVRITGDCPFIDPDMIRVLVNVQKETGSDYVSNLGPQVDGLDCEVFPRFMLEYAYENATSPYEREHVTPLIRKMAAVPITVVRELPLPGIRQHRWTIDDANDLLWFIEIAKALDVTPPAPTTMQLCELLRKRPDLCRYTESRMAA